MDSTTLGIIIAVAIFAAGAALVLFLSKRYIDTDKEGKNTKKDK